MSRKSKVEAVNRILRVSGAKPSWDTSGYSHSEKWMQVELVLAMRTKIKSFSERSVQNLDANRFT